MPKAHIKSGKFKKWKSPPSQCGISMKEDTAWNPRKSNFCVLEFGSSSACKGKFFLWYSGKHWPCSAPFCWVPRAWISTEFLFITPQRCRRAVRAALKAYPKHSRFLSAGLWLLKTFAGNCCPTQELSKVIVLRRSYWETWNNMVTTWRPN